MDYSQVAFLHLASPTSIWIDSQLVSESEEAPLLYSNEVIQAAGENEGVAATMSEHTTGSVPYILQRRRPWQCVPTNDRQRLHYQLRLSQALHQSGEELPDTAARASQILLDAVLEFKPHQMGISLVSDEDHEVSVVLTAYWPTGTLHVEHFFHFPADDPDDTVVNFYVKPTEFTLVSQRQWGWHCPVQEFSKKIRRQFRNGQWPLQGGW